MTSAQGRKLIAERPSQWRESVVDRLNQVCRLPVGWDGYRAGPVSFGAADFALRMLEAACGPAIPPPSIVPGASGDLQIEWHRMDGDIELHVRAPDDVVAWRHTPDTGPEGDEVVLTGDFSVIADWIKSLLEPASAAIGAAA